MAKPGKPERREGETPPSASGAGGKHAGAAADSRAERGGGPAGGMESLSDAEVEARYRTTQRAIQEFEGALASLDAHAKDRPDRMRDVMRDAINSQLADLRDELANLEAHRGARV